MASHVPLALAAAVVLALQGCGGCTDTPPEAPPAPVQGHLPPVAEEKAAAPAAEDQHLCALLIFSDVEEGPAPLRVQLTAEGDCTAGTAKFAWDFGDDSPPATGPNVVHTFEKPGTYVVRATISSDELPGMDDTDEWEIIVTEPAS